MGISRRKAIGTACKGLCSQLIEDTGLVLGYTIYYISQNQAAQNKLREELQSVAKVEAGLDPVATHPFLPHTRSERLRPQLSILSHISPPS